MSLTAKQIIDLQGESILYKAIRAAKAGDAAQQRFLINKYMVKPIELKGKTPMQLLESLIKQTSRHHVDRDSVETALKIIKSYGDVYEMEELEKRISKMEKHYKSKKYKGR